MQQREKNIVWGIAGLVGLYIGYSFFHSWFIQPLITLDENIENATALLDTANRGQRNLRVWEAALADARRISLPRNSSDARRLYLRWIEELTVDSGIQIDRNPESLNEKSDGVVMAYPVKVVGVGTYDQILLFAKRFEQVNLLQRFSQFDLKITEPGDPRLWIYFTAEGVSMAGAPDRSTLFNETQLVDGLAPTQTVLTIADSKGFPEKTPFRIKVGPEWMDVTAINKDQWTVARGVDQSKAATHAKGATVSLYPLKVAGPAEPSVEKAYGTLVAGNPFRKPQPPLKFKPRISPSGSLVVTKGTPWTLKLNTESWNPEAGSPRFVADGELPAGLTLDEKTGGLAWSPAKEFAPGEYKVTITAVGSYNAEFKASKEIAIKVRDANQAPRLSDARPPAAYLGRPWVYSVAGTDPDPNDKLKYALSGTPPMGAAVDATGKVTWTPPEDMEPSEVAITITVTDSGEPPLTTTKAVGVRVEEDAARFTKFVGVVTDDGIPEAWFFDPSVNKNTKLKPGGLFKFADVEGTLETIDQTGDYVVLSTGGKRMRLMSGKTIREMTAEAETPMAQPAIAPTVAPEEKTPTPPKT